MLVSYSSSKAGTYFNDAIKLYNNEQLLLKSQSIWPMILCRSKKKTILFPNQHKRLLEQILARQKSTNINLSLLFFYYCTKFSFQQFPNQITPVNFFQSFYTTQLFVYLNNFFLVYFTSLTQVYIDSYAQ